MLLAHVEVTVVPGVVAEVLSSFSMLHVILPLTFVSLLLFVVDVFSEAVGLVVQELTLIKIAVCMAELSFSIRFTVSDVALICGSILP